MSRGVGELRLIQDFLPEWSALALAVVTQLGDLWLVAILFAALYWRREGLRREILGLAVAVVVGAAAFVSLKSVFALPRPDSPLLAAEEVPALVRPLYTATAFSDGYGFPSGHATVSTVVYFGLASILTLWDRHRQYVVAGTIVAVVSFTRLALGLHYLVDVLAGVALGGAVLVTTRALLARVD